MSDSKTPDGNKGQPIKKSTPSTQLWSPPFPTKKKQTSLEKWLIPLLWNREFSGTENVHVETETSCHSRSQGNCEDFYGHVSPGQSEASIYIINERD